MSQLTALRFLSVFDMGIRLPSQALTTSIPSRKSAAFSGSRQWSTYLQSLQDLSWAMARWLFFEEKSWQPLCPQLGASLDSLASYGCCGEHLIEI